MKKTLLAIAGIISTGSMLAQLPVSTAQENRKVILEEFTGITCQYCPDGHKKADQIVLSNPGSNFVINFHVGGYANPASGAPDFRTPFGTAIVNQAGLTGYPAGTVNRHAFAGLSQNGGTGTAMSRNFWTSAVGQIESLPSIVNVALQATVDAQTRLLTVEVEAFYTGTSTVSTNYFNLALLQDSVLGPQTGGSTWYPAMMVGSQYQHNKIFRHYLTGQWGDVISNPTAGNYYAKTFTYTIPAQLPLSVGTGIKTDVLLSKLKLVGYITETYQEVLSGNKGPLTIVNSGPTGVKNNYDVTEEVSVVLFPNPSTDATTLALLLNKQQNVSVKMYNMLGSVVYTYNAQMEKGPQAIHINTTDLNSGVYFVKVEVGGKTRTEKLTISK